MRKEGSNKKKIGKKKIIQEMGKQKQGEQSINETSLVNTEGGEQTGALENTKSHKHYQDEEKLARFDTFCACRFFTQYYILWILREGNTKRMVSNIKFLRKQV